MFELLPRCFTGPLYVIQSHDSAGRLSRAEVYAADYGPDDYGDGRLVVSVEWRNGRPSGIAETRFRSWSLPDSMAIRDVIESAPEFCDVDELARAIDGSYAEIE